MNFIKNSTVRIIYFRLNFKFIAIVTFIFFSSAVSTSSKNWSKNFPRYIRAGYMAASTIDVIPKMELVGLNTAIPKFDPLPLDFPDNLNKELLKWSTACDKHNMMFLPVINFWSSAHAKGFIDFNPFVTKDGKTIRNLPCPYTKKFWDKWFSPRFIKFVESASKYNQLSGVLIDLELYGINGYYDYSNDCFCDNCFFRYTHSKGVKKRLPEPCNRPQFVAEQGDLAYYHSIQRNAVRNYAKDLKDIIRTINHDLRFGFLKLDSKIPLQQGLALGFGTAENPAFCFTEETYSTGYTHYIDEAKKYFRDMGAHVDLVAGIWQSRIPMPDISGHLYHCARETSGYWIFTMQSFKQPSYLPLTGSIDDNWDAIAKANAELDKLERNHNHISPLHVRPFMPTPNWEWFKKIDMRPEKNYKKRNISSSLFRSNNMIYFYAQEGDTIDFDIEWRKVGRYTDLARVGVVSPNGVQLGYGTIGPEKSFSIKKKASQSGVYGIILQAYKNAVEIVKSSHAYSADTSIDDGAEFISKIPTQFIAIDKNTHVPIELELWTQNAPESILVTIKNDRKEMLWSGVVFGPTKIKINNSKGRYLEISFEKLPFRSIGTLRVRGLKGTNSFISSDPAGLLFEH